MNLLKKLNDLLNQDFFLSFIKKTKSQKLSEQKKLKNVFFVNQQVLLKAVVNKLYCRVSAKGQIVDGLMTNEEEENITGSCRLAGKCKCEFKQFSAVLVMVKQ